MTLHWLQWSTLDLKNGLGGVEVHSRCLDAELKKLGINTGFSSNPQDLNDPKWDVIHTHGSAVSLAWESSSAQSQHKAIRVHGVHGTTLGRMAHCREWWWLGGYAAAWREWVALKNTDIAFFDHASLWMLPVAKKLGKKTQILSNGWDAGTVLGDAPTADAREWPKSFFVFVGRGQDPVKGVDLIESALKHTNDSVHLLAIPGGGFREDPKITKTGPLPSSQVLSLMQKSKGLILSSHYEGLPLVVLEALGLGVPVIHTNVGGLKTLPESLHGRFVLKSRSQLELAHWMNELDRQDSLTHQSERANENQKLLRSWKQIAELALESVLDWQKGSRS